MGANAAILLSQMEDRQVVSLIHKSSEWEKLCQRLLVSNGPVLDDNILDYKNEPGAIIGGVSGHLGRVYCGCVLIGSY